MLRLPERRRSATINVTPLVDVVLVLLIVFMVMTPLAERELFERLPQDEPTALPVPADQVAPDQLVLTVRSDGRVLLNQEESSVDDAMRSLADAYRGHPARVLFFNAEDRVPYELAVSVLDRARGAGVNVIGMLTDPPVVRPRHDGVTRP